MAVGEVLRRIVSKMLMQLGPMKRAAVELEPVQCGLGMRGACELIGTATSTIVRQLCAAHTGEKGWAVLQVDLSNAFNRVSRDAMLRAFKARCPQALHWMASSYGRPAHLFCGQLSLLSHSGVQQGDNMGPAGFCFAAQDILEDIGAEEGLLWQAWYMDGGTIIGTMEGLARAAEILLEEGPARGLFLNRAKCVLWGPGRQRTWSDVCLPWGA